MDNAPGSSPADLVFAGGSVWTGTEGPPSDAVAIANGRIVGVGRLAEIKELTSPRSEVIDLRDRLLVPGFNDAHVHPIAGGLERLRCDLTGANSAAGYKDVVRRYVESRPGIEWILGGGWMMSAFPGGNPRATDLDEVAPGSPAFLYNRDHHGAWVNSRALELAGIDASTPDPSDGRIERDADGRPTGMLHEGAMGLVERLVPPPTNEDLMAGLIEGQRYLHARGVTAWQDAIVGEEFLGTSTLPVYLDALKNGTLSAKVRGALWLERGSDLGALDELIADRESARAAGFDAGTIKIMQDGVVEGFTAAMIDPYFEKDGRAGGRRGISFFEPEFLNEFVPRADAAGFQVHFHAIGDRAVRECLDAVAAARQKNGMNDHRHHIAHIQVVHPDDVSRFAALGVVANAQPLWAAFEAQMRELNVPFLGSERTGWQYPFRSLLDSGAHLAFGSDWPVSSPDPFAAMHVAVNRTEAPSVAEGDVDPEPLVPSEAIDFQSALRAYTQGSAYVSHLENTTGTIEVGKDADLVVLDGDLAAWGAGEVDGTKVDLTFVKGRVVHERLG